MVGDDPGGTGAFKDHVSSGAGVLNITRLSPPHTSADAGKNTCIIKIRRLTHLSHIMS